MSLTFIEKKGFCFARVMDHSPLEADTSTSTSSSYSYFSSSSLLPTCISAQRVKQGLQELQDASLWKPFAQQFVATDRKQNDRLHLVSIFIALLPGLQLFFFIFPSELRFVFPRVTFASLPLSVLYLYGKALIQALEKCSF